MDIENHGDGSPTLHDTGVVVAALDRAISRLLSSDPMSPAARELRTVRASVLGDSDATRRRQAMAEALRMIDQLEES